MNPTDAKKAIGTIVHVSDGTPRPPVRFNKKVEAWENNNYSGILTEVTANWDNTGYSRSIEIQNLGYMVFNKSGFLDNVAAGVHPLAPAHASIM